MRERRTARRRRTGRPSAPRAPAQAHGRQASEAGTGCPGRTPSRAAAAARTRPVRSALDRTSSSATIGDPAAAIGTPARAMPTPVAPGRSSRASRPTWPRAHAGHLEIERALGGRAVLAELQRASVGDARILQGGRHRGQHVERLRQQLSRTPRIAQLVRALTIEAQIGCPSRAGGHACDSLPPATRAPAVAQADRGARCAGTRRGGSRLSARAVGQRQCARSDARHRQGRRLEARRSGDGSMMSTAVANSTPPRLLSSRAQHALAGNRAGNQDDLAVQPRQHPAAGRGLLDEELDEIARTRHRYSPASAGSCARSRSSRA